jgi:hypothetical protein
VTPSEAIRYVAYEGVFVLGPGWLLLRVISPGLRSLPWQIALAWPLGLVLELACFALSAGLDVRQLFLAYPLAVGLPCAVVLWRRRRADRGVEPGQAEVDRFTGAQRWAIAGLCVAGFAYLGLTLVAFSPLPGSVPSVFYPPDLMFHIAVAADAKHHWPPGDPLVSGGALHYHYFFHLHAAAVSQVTGIGLPVLVLRLCVVPMVALLVLQLSMLGRAVSGIGWAGPLTAGLALAAWELDLSVPDVAPFLGNNDIWFWLSPTYLLGLVFLVPLLALVAGLVDPGIMARTGGLRSRRAALTLIGLLLLGAGGSKVAAIPVIAGGLALYLLWRLHRRQTFDRTAAAVLALCVAVSAAFAAALYSGGGGSELRVSIGGIYELMPSLSLLQDGVSDGPLARIAFWGVGFLATTLLHFGPALLGLYWILGKGRPPLRSGQVFLLCVLVAGLPAWFLLVDDNADNAYFTAFGMVAALPLAAEGLWRGVGGWLGRHPGTLRRLPVAGSAWIALLLAIAYAGWELTLNGHPATAYALVYGALGLGLLAVFVWAWRADAAGRRGAAAAVAVAVLLAAGLDPLLDSAPTAARELVEGDPLYDPGRDGAGFTRQQLDAARWIKDETDTDAVLSISNQRSPQGRRLAPLRAEFPAFSERRTFYEGWVYSRDGLSFRDVAAGTVEPDPDRRRLEARVFNHGDGTALAELERDYGVTHLVIDRRDGPVPASVYSMGTLIYSNGAVDVIELP